MPCVIGSHETGPEATRRDETVEKGRVDEAELLEESGKTAHTRRRGP
ncbi:hypothetical protein [Natrinema gelatinilyticum]|nr:hypothetical protein [Natrinema gelatinilyticum]